MAEKKNNNTAAAAHQTTGKRKRSSPPNASITNTPITQNGGVVDEDPLTLSLSPYPRNPTPTTTVPPPAVRRRRNPTTTPPAGKPATISPPYPWSGNLRASVRKLGDLRSEGIRCISGEVQCKRCNGTYRMELDLEEKLKEVSDFIGENIAEMNHRAPRSWMNPALTNCQLCNQRGSVKPLMCEKKKGINWLFLFLGQTVGCCTLDQLKYFCKHNKIHRTGAKDRLVFSTYSGVYKQLQPNAP